MTQTTVEKTIEKKRNVNDDIFQILRSHSQKSSKLSPEEYLKFSELNDVLISEKQVKLMSEIKKKTKPFAFPSKAELKKLKIVPKFLPQESNAEYIKVKKPGYIKLDFTKLQGEALDYAQFQTWLDVPPDEKNTRQAPYDYSSSLHNLESEVAIVEPELSNVQNLFGSNLYIQKYKRANSITGEIGIGVVGGNIEGINLPMPENTLFGDAISVKASLGTSFNIGGYPYATRNSTVIDASIDYEVLNDSDGVISFIECWPGNPNSINQGTIILEGQIWMTLNCLGQHSIMSVPFLTVVSYYDDDYNALVPTQVYNRTGTLNCSITLPPLPNLDQYPAITNVTAQIYCYRYGQPGDGFLGADLRGINLTSASVLPRSFHRGPSGPIAIKEMRCHWHF